MNDKIRDEQMGQAHAELQQGQELPAEDLLAIPEYLDRTKKQEEQTEGEATPDSETTKVGQ